MALQLTTTIFAYAWLALFAAIASAGHLSSSSNNHFGRPTTRLQRQELSPTAYPAAGFRPAAPFNYPDGVENFEEESQTQFQTQLQFQPHPQVQLPRQFQPLPQTQSQLQPQAGHQQRQPQSQLSGFDLAATPNLGANGDQVDTPSGLYAAPARLRQTQQLSRQRQQQGFARQQFSSAAREQSARFTQAFQPQLQQSSTRASAPQRYRNSAAAAEELEDLRSQRLTAPSRQGKQFGRLQQQSSAVPRFERLRSATAIATVKFEPSSTPADEDEAEDQREDFGDDEGATDIETNAERKPTVAGRPPVVAPPTTATTTSVFYYPAGAFGFVHPVTGAYYEPGPFLAGPAPAPAPLAPAAPAGIAPDVNAASPAATAEVASTAQAVAKPAALNVFSARIATPASAPLAIATQYYAASPYVQQYTLASPAAQLQAW